MNICTRRETRRCVNWIWKRHMIISIRDSSITCLQEWILVVSEGSDQSLYHNNFFRDYDEGPLEFLKVSRSIRPGDLLSPLLFIIVMEALNKPLVTVREVGMITELNVGEGEGEENIKHLFLADDTLIFCQLDERQLLNLRCVLLYFQVVSDRNIDLAKSKMVG